MKFSYYPETDSLYISLSEKTSTDSQEIAPDIVLDFDSEGKLVGIDIDQASQIVDLTRLETESFPLNSVILSQSK
ncbi:MAG: DUF2283 domain-containing protein [Microcystis sp. M_OC_Ca_00000000_S217Cul]|jgi:uncharacterized protein YuzE|uniref:DUF2283 domain-containing protein n=1 Tax=Microcystis TaxID=1125 RepID=UPI00093395F2|nr:MULTISPECIES: DUF2283 domain-containing protein [Microcystis]AVQ74072.1 hypothetical protein B5D77_24760 [Microcystis sp. MC19]MCA2717732.1 DUF2283 domain-containing protein [Microcystis sp. M169S2]TRT75285.1 MAG: DUF2283 domain-containing protein [Microcystis sp. M_OC_Ca_00000000_S217Cul]TRT86513.1 MAG: DUF2283 domain-containing protein [Microcystis sp. M_OC_Ca_00000000_C217Col]WNF13019.1 DUF2283 domain-containing protein [Microcystis aeruginosa NRERC-214]